MVRVKPRSTTHIDLPSFWADPYPALKTMRETAPVTFVPELNAWLITRRDDIFEYEKRVEIFSSVQPEGLMTRLMGQNMMRKDGEAHQIERRAIFPSLSPKTVRDVWRAQFEVATREILDNLAQKGRCDLVRDFAMPVSGEALKSMTGLTNMSATEMDRVSQGMIDGCANYLADPEIEAHCVDCTGSIDRHIDDIQDHLRAHPDHSILSVLTGAGLPDDQIRANIKLAISGGQNEPRDAIAGTCAALLDHPDQHEMILSGKHSYLDAFEEFARWMSPIGMSPREIAQDIEIQKQTLLTGDRAFLMFGSGNRDAACFANPSNFDISQDRSKAISFGAGPHFCAGAWASRSMIGDVALPMLFERFPNLKRDTTDAVEYVGWAFRGPKEVTVSW